MKLKCGKTVEEEAAELQRGKEWRRWFAWYPVQIAKGDCRWLEYIERREHFEVSISEHASVWYLDTPEFRAST